MATTKLTAWGGGGLHSEVRPLLRSVVGMVLGSGVSALANFALVVVLARSSDPETVGILMAGISLFLIAVVVARMGTPAGLVYFISRSRALRRPGYIGRSLKLSAAPVVAACLVVSAALWFWAEPLARTLGADGADAETVAMMHILAASVSLAAVFEIATAVLEGFRKMGPTALLDRVIRPLLQLGLVAAVAAPGALVVLTGAWVLPYLPVLAVALLWAWWVVREATKSPADGGAVDSDGAEQSGRLSAREFWVFTTPRWLSSMLQVALQRLDIFLVAILAGPTQAAIYATATRAIVVGQMLQQAIGQVVQPRFGESLAMGDRQHAQALYTTSTSWLVLLTWPIFLTVSILSVPFLGLFGDEYTSGWPIIVILSLSLMVATATGTVDIVLTMSGRSAVALANAFAAFLLMVVVDLLTVPAYGAIAAAWAWALSILARTFLPLWQVHRDLGLHPYHRPTIMSMVWTLGATGAVPLAIAVASGWTLAGQLVGCTVGLLILGIYVLVRRKHILTWPNSEEGTS